VFATTLIWAPTRDQVRYGRTRHGGTMYIGIGTLILIIILILLLT
jgi:hypothetical protein